MTFRRDGHPAHRPDPEHRRRALGHADDRGQLHLHGDGHRQPGATGSQSYTVTINPAVTITTTTLANWTAGQAGYSQTISATGGTGAMTFATTRHACRPV